MNLKIKYTGLVNAVYLLLCGWIIGSRCLLVIMKEKFGKITHPEMNKIVNQAAVRLMDITKTKYTATHIKNIQFEEQTPYIFMSNHQSLFDIPLIYATLPGTIRFVAKKELFKIPAFGKMLKISGCIPIDRSKPASESGFYELVRKRLCEKILLWIFPEGTRSRDDSLLAFKKGSFRLAQEISAKIIPVGINNTRSVLPPGKFSLGFHQTVEIVIGEPIDTRDYKNTNDLDALINKVRQSIEKLTNKVVLQN